MARLSSPPLPVRSTLKAPSPAQGKSPEKREQREHAQVHLLIVEDDASIRQVCTELGLSLGYHVRSAESLPHARALLQSGPVDIVLLDLHLPGGTGAELLHHLRETTPAAAVVIMTAHASIASAVELLRAGACNYLSKPFSLDQLQTALEEAKGHWQRSESSRTLREQLASGKGAGALIGDSAAMHRVFRLISKVAFTRHPVLIQGEFGTGKETIARTIHSHGPDAAAPFVPVDCFPVRPDLLEDALFGRSPGQAGSEAQPLGILSRAGRGTVFLDQVGDLPLPVQARLLRAIDERQIRFPGTETRLPLQCRILAASSRKLDDLVTNGLFRRDLYQRLNVVKMEIPPLRDRSVDVLLLADHFLKRQVREHGIRFVLSDEVVHFFMQYTWPENLRELETVIERVCALTSGPLIHMGDMQTQVQSFARQMPPQPKAAVEDLRPMQDVERETILKAMAHFGGDKLLAAKALGIGKTTLYRKLKEYGMGEDIQ
jgi:DNA-binding NtrC family response regulator